MVGERLDSALKAAGIPIISVSIGDEADRGTWRIEYAKEATDQQRADGDALLKTFDPESPAVVSEYTGKVASAEADRVIVRAMLRWFLRRELRREPTPEEIAAERASFLQAFIDESV